MNAAGKADVYLAEGRVVVEQVTQRMVLATVRGDGARYCVTYTERAGWSCDCPARSRCCHLLAVRKVTAVDLTG
jgi:hypothetical protein